MIALVLVNDWDQCLHFPLTKWKPKMMKRISLALFVLASMVLPITMPTALAQQVKPACTDNSRACLVKTANLYLDGLAHHDASKIPFAPDVRCTEQDNVPAANEVEFRKSINDSGVIQGIRSLRLMADPETQSVSAFYFLDIGAVGKEHAYTVMRGQRFKIVHGLVKEVEVYNYVNPKLTGLAKPFWP